MFPLSGVERCLVFNVLNFNGRAIGTGIMSAI